MTASSERQSAKIYQFPIGGRAALGGRREVAKPVSDVAPARAAKVVVGSSWYHEDAIQEAVVEQTLTH